MGKCKGWKSVDPAVIKHAKVFVGEKMSKTSVAKQMKIGVSTLFKYLVM